MPLQPYPIKKNLYLSLLNFLPFLKYIIFFNNKIFMPCNNFVALALLSSYITLNF